MALLFRGESRRKIFRHHLFWIKIAEIVLPLLMFPFCVVYEDQGSLHTKDKIYWFNITVKYPFKYYENITAIYTEEETPLKFSFDGAINICAQLFVAVSVLSMMVALVMVVFSIIVHKADSMARPVMYSELFSAIIVSFLLVMSTSLWLYNVFTLRKEVEGELNRFASYAKSNCVDGQEDCNPIKKFPDYTTLFLSVGFGFVTFLVWLVNTVLVYRDILQPVQEDTNGNNALIWAQELPDTHNRNPEPAQSS
ncbi:uncharacterized protein LOC116290332 [Actinia tenebrosa]|uniref:Uncharacterized protein LOC116290332 n=1 Tax=Actinia tenebrosa TaxID=6105 RepID=A0A6P8HC35_ACTTE|nr:uncharacterized protein LOC116290332 [Actinia tenebrosa]